MPERRLAQVWAHKRIAVHAIPHVAPGSSSSGRHIANRRNRGVNKEKTWQCFKSILEN